MFPYPPAMSPTHQEQTGQRKGMWASSPSSTSLFVYPQALQEEGSVSLITGAPGYSRHPGNHHQGLGVLLGTAAASRRGQILSAIFTGLHLAQDLETRD